MSGASALLGEGERGLLLRRAPTCEAPGLNIAEAATHLLLEAAEENEACEQEAVDPEHEVGVDDGVARKGE